MKRIGILHLLILILGSAFCFAGSFYLGLQKTLAAARAAAAVEEEKAAQESKPVAEAVPEDSKSAAPPEPSPDKKLVTPQKVAEELDGWRKELSEREKKLLSMDADILRRNNLINAERDALRTEREKLTSMQKEIESRLLEVTQTEVANSEQISQLYSGMKPVEACGIMRQLTDPQVARLLAVMKPTKSAKILETWSRTFPDDRERLARISDQMGTIVKENDQPKVTINTP
jgi:flagellar motility protein MotE (MotC chaperone)